VFVVGPDKRLKLSILYPATTGRATSPLNSVTLPPPYIAALFKLRTNPILPILSNPDFVVFRIQFKHPCFYDPEKRGKNKIL
jgi:hypothetical protein